MRLESYPVCTARRAARGPLRSFVELAADHHLTHAELRGYLAAEGAPKPARVARNVSYYEPRSFGRWLGARRAN